jgi:hypothetical protein
MEVGNRVITLVPVHVDHYSVKRADAWHSPALLSQSALTGRIDWSQTLGPPPLSICQKAQPLRLSFTLGL